MTESFFAECLEARSTCPVCQTQCTTTSLLKNIHLDRVIALADAEKEKASKKEFSKLAQPSDSGTAANLRPLEEIFRKHLRKCMVAYDERYNSLMASREADYAKIRQECNKKVEEHQKVIQETKDDAEKARAQQSVVDAQRVCQAELTRVQQQYDRTLELLLTGYDQFVVEPLSFYS